MNSQHSPANEYLEAQVKTATPERLHLMVVDAAIRFGQQGLEAIGRLDLERSWIAFNRSRACVAELIAGVRPEPNPELAADLKSVFVFAHRQLALADQTHDPQKAADAVRVLQTHRETWIELMQRLQSERQPAAVRSLPPTSASAVPAPKLFRSV